MSRILILGLLLCKLHAGGAREERTDPKVTLEVQVQPANFPFQMTLPLSDVSEIQGLGKRMSKIRKAQKEESEMLKHMRKEAARRDGEFNEMRQQVREMSMRILALESALHAVPTAAAAHTPTSGYSIWIREARRLEEVVSPVHASPRHAEPYSPAAASVRESEGSEWLTPDMPQA